MSFGKSKARVQMEPQTQVTFGDVAGIEGAKLEPALGGAAAGDQVLGVEDRQADPGVAGLFLLPGEALVSARFALDSAGRAAGYTARLHRAAATPGPGGGVTLDLPAVESVSIDGRDNNGNPVVARVLAGAAGAAP